MGEGARPDSSMLLFYRKGGAIVNYNFSLRADFREIHKKRVCFLLVIVLLGKAYRGPGVPFGGIFGISTFFIYFLSEVCYTVYGFLCPKGGEPLLNKDLRKIIQPGFTLYFLVFLIFSVVAAYLEPVFGLVSFAAWVLLILCSHLSSRSRRRAVMDYMRSLSLEIDQVSRTSITTLPMPALVAMATTGEILWSNDSFNTVTGNASGLMGVRINEIAPTFDTRWLIDGRPQYPTELRIGKNSFHVFGSLLAGEHEIGALMVLYFVECTDYVRLRDEYDETRPVVAILSIDNYEELLKNLDDSEKSNLLAGIDKRIVDWASASKGLLRKYDRDKYLFILENGALQKLVNRKFSILGEVREISSNEGIAATLTIGVGKDADTFNESFRFASLALEMGLSRGGDQAVIKNKYAFEFFGGMSQEVEKRTKVKSRVVANALSQLIRDSSQVLVMGHSRADMDAIGAAIGLVCAVREREKPVHIVVDPLRNLSKELIARFDNIDQYKGVFIDPDAAMVMCDFNTLLIVVDTNRPDYVESPALLESINKVAVIDHHRRAASYIEHSVLNLHEPYASSASELVSELLQYMVSANSILPAEAEALLAGIFLDTKGFSVKAGVRTFEAAAYLKRAGAEVTSIKTLFQSSFQEYMSRANIIAGATDCGGGIILAVTEEEKDRATAGKAADELMNISGVQASVVLFRNGDDAIISARSNGQVNVQVLMEKLGGGGSQSSAGAQIRNTPVLEVESRLRGAIQEYLTGDAPMKKKEAET